MLIITAQKPKKQENQMFRQFLLTFFLLLCPFTAFANSLDQELALWQSLVENPGQHRFEAYETFLLQRPDWPYQNTLKSNAERRMTSDLGATKITGWFDKNPPRTKKGFDLYIQSLIAKSKMSKARQKIRLYWAETDMDRGAQKSFYGQYKAFLNQDSHQKRFFFLAAQSKLREGNAGNLRAVAGLLGPNYQSFANALIALKANESNALTLVKTLPESFRSNPVTIYEELRWLRRQEKTDRAAAFLKKHPLKASEQRDARDWWRERHILIRRLLEEKRFQNAYDLASIHQQEEGSFAYAQAEWLSGWITLDFLNKPVDAFQHFEALYLSVKTPISKGRAAYWAGLASEKAGTQKIADQWFQVAGQYAEVFYGQLALKKIGQNPAFSNARRNVRINRNAATGAEMPMLYAASYFYKRQEDDYALNFLFKFLNEAKTPQDFEAALAVTQKFDQAHAQIHVAQNAIQKGFDYFPFAYPVVDDVKTTDASENAFVHAIIRQESRFKKDAVSHAGALGLMQLMPGTARERARKDRINYRENWLLSRPDYNIMLGRSYLKFLEERYNGSYALMAAAYNAGPGRVDRWLEEIGDPRNGEIDPVRWIELLPIYETRNYVQRVIEAANVYAYFLNKSEVENDFLHQTMNQ